MYSPCGRLILFRHSAGSLNQRKSLPNRYPTPKKMRITITTTAATRAIIDSSSEPALRSMQESSHSHPSPPGGGAMSAFREARAGPIR